MYYYLHVPDEETEPQRGSLTCHRARKGQNQECKLSTCHPIGPLAAILSPLDTCLLFLEQDLRRPWLQDQERIDFCCFKSPPGCGPLSEQPEETDRPPVYPVWRQSTGLVQEEPLVPRGGVTLSRIRAFWSCSPKLVSCRIIRSLDGGWRKTFCPSSPAPCLLESFSRLKAHFLIEPFQMPHPGRLPPFSVLPLAVCHRYLALIVAYVFPPLSHHWSADSLQGLRSDAFVPRVQG